MKLRAPLEDIGGKCIYIGLLCLSLKTTSSSWHSLLNSLEQQHRQELIVFAVLT